MTKRDALVRLSNELTKLIKTSGFDESKKKLLDQQFDGFQNLFGKYLEADAAPPLTWDKIEKLPTGSVCSAKKYLIFYMCVISKYFNFIDFAICLFE